MRDQVFAYATGLHEFGLDEHVEDADFLHDAGCGDAWAIKVRVDEGLLGPPTFDRMGGTLKDFPRLVHDGPSATEDVP